MHLCIKKHIKIMTKQRQRLVEVPFSKTDCGVDFYINTAYGDECPWVLIVKPHQQQEWHIDEAALDYEFLIFREDFMRTSIHQ